MTNEHKRYGWFRVYEGVGTHQVWQRAANMISCSVAETFAVGMMLMIVASKGRPRGSVADFDAEGCAAVLRIPTERVEAICEAFRGGKKPWIDRDRIVDWDERQPVPDATHAERQHRYRERKRETVTALRDVTSPLRHIPPRDVTVTDRDLDKKIITSSTLVQEQKGTSEGSPVKPPHTVTRAELEVIVEQKRIAREAMLEEKRKAIQKGYGSVK